MAALRINDMNNFCTLSSHILYITLFQLKHFLLWVPLTDYSYKEVAVYFKLQTYDTYGKTSDLILPIPSYLQENENKKCHIMSHNMLIQQVHAVCNNKYQHVGITVYFTLSSHH